MAVTEDIAMREMLQRAAMMQGGLTPGPADLNEYWKYINAAPSIAAWPPPAPRYTHSTHPIEAKIRRAFDRVSEQLPFRLAAKIQIIRFGPDDVLTDARF